MELLVVIAIIALLVSILMPSLQAAKTLARTAVCQSNVHRLALGNGMYIAEYDGFSVHGNENAYALATMPGGGKPGYHSGYGVRMEPTQFFDDDFGNTKLGTPYSIGDDGGNGWLGGAQNICNVGQLMWDRYIEESADSIGCPQADFVEMTPFSGSSSGALAGDNYQHVKKMMAYPKLDPDKSYGDPNYSNPNAYWRNEFFNGSPDYYWETNRWISSYVVRGPLFRSGDVLNQSGESEISYLVHNIAPKLRSKADSQVAIFADHEWAGYMLGQFERAGALAAMGYDKPAWTYFPRRHLSGPVVAYTDGHSAIFQDESRRKTWNHYGKYYGNFTHYYHNGWAMFTHIFDEE